MQKVYLGDQYYAVIQLPWEETPNLDSIQDDLSSGKAKLAIWYPMESMFYNNDDFIINEANDPYETNPIYRKDHPKIDKLLSKYNIDDWVLLDNNPYNEILYPNKCIYIPNFARHSVNTASDQWEFARQLHERKATFSSFNRRTTEVRLQIVNHIRHKDAIWSCGPILDNQPTQYSHLHNLLPKTVDQEFTAIGTGMKTPTWLYQSAYIHIVNETDTWYDPNYLFITEKTYNCFNSRTPFLMVGQPFTLKHLNDIGFKTFSEYWDESYDEELNTTKRASMVCDLMDKIELNYLDMFKGMQDILDHNYNHLRTFDYSLDSKLSTFGFK
tara:strand:- start:10378 stop:11358 length:981 start_codon:yes stop_codon:yes gene_type:complete